MTTIKQQLIDRYYHQIEVNGHSHSEEFVNEVTLTPRAEAEFFNEVSHELSFKDMMKYHNTGEIIWHGIKLIKAKNILY